MSLNSAAYTTGLLQAVVETVPRGEIEAARALAMSAWLRLRKIILPRAFVNLLPAYSNEVVLVLKGTSLASTITLLDLMGITRQLIAQTYQPMEGLLVAGVIYLMITIVIVMSFKWVEQRFILPH